MFLLLEIYILPLYKFCFNSYAFYRIEMLLTCPFSDIVGLKTQYILIVAFSLYSLVDRLCVFVTLERLNV